MNSVTCLGCSASLACFPPSRNPRKWCSDSCRVEAYRAAHPEKRTLQRERARVRNQAKRLPPKRCLHCGEVKLSRKGDYCRVCTALPVVRRALHLGHAVCTVCDCGKPVNGRGLCGTHYQRWWRQENPDAYRTRRSRGNAARKLAVAAAFLEKVSPVRVFELDGWRCHLCGKKMNRRLKHPDPLSASIDHVIPLSKGGTHSYGNCRAAHLGCNSAKSNRGGGEQMLLAVS